MRQISFIEMRTYFSFGLILRDIPNSITPQTTFRLLPIPVGLLVFPCTRQCRQSPPLTPSPPLLLLSRTEEPVKDGTCARDRRALQQLALNVHVKHSDVICLARFRFLYHSFLTVCTVCAIFSVSSLEALIFRFRFPLFRF